MLIKEPRLLATALFVADREGIIRDIQIVGEVSQEPDYDSVLDMVRKVD